MPGIFGNQQNMGLLGSYQQQETPGWANTLGILSAGLKDAVSGVQGQESNSLQNWQQSQRSQMIQRQLMDGLQSQDPATRQQAYGLYTMMGGDPKPFQQMQAQQALPQLLKSMQPNTQQIPALNATLPPSVPGGGGQVTTGSPSYDAPGLSLNEAVLQAPPELQTQLAPKMLDSLMKGPDNTPHEGVNPTTGKLGQYVMNNGTPQWLDVGVLPKAPTSRHVRIGGNDVTQEFDAATGGWKEVGRGAAFKPDDETAPDPATVNYWAQSVAAGAPLPALGMGKQAALYRQAILKGAAAINNGQGLTGVDQNVNSATTKANTSTLAKQTALRSATEGFENTMLQNMNVVRDLLKKGAGTTGIPVLNRYQQYLKGQYGGDPDVVALGNAIDTVADENAKIRSGTLGNTPATDAMRASIHKGLNDSQTPDQILGSFSVMEKDAGNRSRSLRAQEAALKKGLQGKNDIPQIPGIREPQASPPSMPSQPQALPRLPAANTKTINGQTYINRNGQWYHQ